MKVVTIESMIQFNRASDFHLESTTLLISASDNAIDSSFEAEESLVKQIYEIIDHFKGDDPVGLPFVPMPDPTVIIYKLEVTSLNYECLVFRMCQTSSRAFPC